MSHDMFPDHKHSLPRELSWPFIVDDHHNVIGHMDSFIEDCGFPLPKSFVELISIRKMQVLGMGSGLSGFRAAPYFDRNCQVDFYTGDDDAEGCALRPYWVLQCYNVLWVESKAGIAYRRSLDKVWPNYWGDAEKDEIGIRIG